MKIQTIKTGYVLVSSAVPNRNTHKFSLAYMGLFQDRKKRLKLPVKCFYISIANHNILIDAGWSKEVTIGAKKHLGIGLYFASEPVMKENEAAINQLGNKKIDAILMTHLDCDHVSGLHDFNDIPVFTTSEEIAYSKRNKLRYGKLIKNLKFNCFKFTEDKNAPFLKSIDVFGDNSIIAYLTPTHSAGSVIYRINEDDKFALIVGDNGYDENSWKNGLLPGPLYNEENMKKILTWINNMSNKVNCFGVYCAHDPIDR